MDREILFRGKVADEPDEWVQGHLRDEETIFQQTRHKKSKCCDYGFFSVKPDTVGQYTGLIDKNGTKIFEGDVVKVSGVAKAKIIWNNEDACFAFDYGKDGRPLCLDFIDDTSIEVIGNIYDNPELLEEDK